LREAARAACSDLARMSGIGRHKHPPLKPCNYFGVQILSSNPVLAVHDLARSAAWYRDVPGCEIRDAEPGNWTFCRSGAIDIMLGRCPEAMPASELGDHSYVAYLRVDDVAAFHTRAVNSGAEILKPPTDEPWGMREFGVRSPGGHRFMLGQPVPS
jgi:uncharacterized glyoxalase superfamily protein PhnB